MHLLNPLSGDRIELPPYRGEPFLDKEESRYPYKVILSHPPRDEACRAVMILGSRDRAAFCAPGRCQRWSPLGRWYESPRPGPLEDTDIFFSDFLYSASRKSFLSAMQAASSSPRQCWGALEFRDADSMSRVKMARPPRYTSDPSKIWQTYLVSEEESGQLFVVRRYLINKKRVDYNVYKIVCDDDGQEVVQLCDSLDGLVMFIGINHC